MQNELWGNPDVLGYVLCINGEQTECTVDDHIAAQCPDWTPEMIACICEHELNHITTGVHCSSCGFDVGGLPDTTTANQSECSAYNAQWDCLNDIEPKTQAVTDALVGIWSHIKYDLQCPTVPDPFS